MNLPDKKTINKLYDKYGVPDNIKAHMKSVSKVAVKLAKKLNESGENIDIDFMEACGLLHDIAKFITLNNGGNHAEIGEQILQSEGFSEIGIIIRSHSNDFVVDKDGYKKWFSQPMENKILNYSDFRVLNDKVVSLDKRLEYLNERYPKSHDKFIILADILRDFEKRLGEKGIDIYKI